MHGIKLSVGQNDACYPQNNKEAGDVTMVKITFAPANRHIQVRVGETILRAASRARIAISQRCGGKGACTMCKVRVTPGSFVSPPQEKEKRMIGEEHLACGMRLACQARVQGEAQVELAESRLASVVRTQLEKQRQERGEW
jgi:2Fe-2S ferredoxin